jgi:hypothetical protein
MQAFRALSYRDMWRVSMCLRRGEAPDEPRLAAAAVDLAEGYRRQGRVKAALISWYPLVAIVWLGLLSISIAARGDEWVLIPYVLVVPLGIAGFLLDPGCRPQNVVSGTVKPGLLGFALAPSERTGSRRIRQVGNRIRLSPGKKCCGLGTGGPIVSATPCPTGPSKTLRTSVAFPPNRANLS